MTLAFQIDSTQIEIIEDPQPSNSFEVQSAIHPYVVRFSTKTPEMELTQRLQQIPTRGLLIDEKLLSLYPRLSHHPRTHAFKAQEKLKDLELGVLPFLRACAQWNLTSLDGLCVVGGGITQEVGATSAALYKRGLPWTLYPSTLLSMCDSCLGGKTSLNFESAKNQLGLYSPPHEIVICPDFLSTLPEFEIFSGLGEILKLHVLGGEKYFQEYLKLEHLARSAPPSQRGAIIEPLIRNALLIKKAIVERDEFDTHERKSMNYGHTLGHAFEALTQHRVSHGQAVVAGMLLINAWAHRQGWIDPEFHKTFEAAAFRLLPITTRQELAQLPWEDLGPLLAKDKKNRGSTLLFIQPEKPGITRYREVSNDAPLSASLRNLFTETFKDQK